MSETVNVERGNFIEHDYSGEFISLQPDALCNQAILLLSHPSVVDYLVFRFYQGNNNAGLVFPELKFKGQKQWPDCGGKTNEIDYHKNETLKSLNKSNHCKQEISPLFLYIERCFMIKFKE